MRSFLKLTLAGAGVVALSCAAAADPYFHSDVNGSWTNSEYNDGTCHYSFSRDASDGETHLNRWGHCSHIAIGPNGEPLQVIPPPQTTGSAVFVPEND
jgi:opacity protein-like surface antigen